MPHEADDQKVEIVRPHKFDDGRHRMARHEVGLERQPSRRRELPGALDDRGEALFGFLPLAFESRIPLPSAVKQKKSLAFQKELYY